MTEGPLIVQSDKTVLLEVDHELAGAARAAIGVAGRDHVDANCAGLLAAEDFSFYLERIPGAYGFIGNGPVTDEAGPVHNPTYDFNDEILTRGAHYLAEMARTAIAEISGASA